LAVSSRLTELTPTVRVSRSALYRTAGGVVAGRDGAVLLVDPGVLPGELAGLAAELDAAGLRVAAAAATHAHWDHVLWAEALGAAPRLATARTAELLAARRHDLVELPLARWGDEHYVRFEVELAGRLQAAPADGMLPWPGPRVRLVPAGGHCPGHAAVLVEPDGVLFAGDMLSDVKFGLECKACRAVTSGFTLRPWTVESAGCANRQRQASVQSRPTTQRCSASSVATMRKPEPLGGVRRCSKS
jgi:glyoxylase-like metal-dependent hydrolase (beta-lactamase superfamily II)